MAMVSQFDSGSGSQSLLHLHLYLHLVLRNNAMILCHIVAHSFSLFPVHHLLFREGLVDKWEEQGKTHVIFLQDTNALVINSVLPTLGVSVAKGFHMNSICIPRLAGEAAGAIARLEHKTDPNKSLVINVEYNQLDPLLRTQGDCLGDVADPDTGYSPFPGNANNLVLELSAYAKTLRGEDQGVVLEFVNPKYKDATRTEFKKPTRLECMMQDIPKLFQKEMGSQANIGFTLFDRWFTFSPAKNALDAGQEAVAAGNTAPGTMSSAESDKYIQNQRKLKFAGVNVPVTADAADMMTIAGIPVTAGPRIILCPAFGITQKEILDNLPSAESVSISKDSSVVLEGHNLTVKSMQVNGALVIRAGPESHVTVDGLIVENKGWELQELDPAQTYPEHVQIRGYTMVKHETVEFIINEPGNFVIDATGQVQKV
jgi:UDP-sugar pyrophosphorylase